MTELNRNDVLDLLDIASSMSDDSLTRLLSKFCEMVEKVRFCSLWRLNNRSNSISIYARSNSDYKPQLGQNDENYQEFNCSIECPSVKSILQSENYWKCERSNESIRDSRLYGIFHPEKIVEQYKLDHFIVLPITAEHAPEVSQRKGEPPRFFCLFYCPLGINAEEISDEDLQLIKICIGNVIYNRFNETRHKKIKDFTNYLSNHHDPDTNGIINQLQECIPCYTAMHISQPSETKSSLHVNSTGIDLDDDDLNQFIWSEALENGSKILDLDEFNSSRKSTIKSVMIYNIANDDESSKSVLVFVNKLSKSPLKEEGLPTFVDHFSFDDAMLLNDIGEHFRAFTDTRSEKKRREDMMRIAAHEVKQPIIDIRNNLAKYQNYPENFDLLTTLERINDASELALALAEINTDATTERLKYISLNRSVRIELKPSLEKMRLLLRSLCDDSNFKNANISLDIDESCTYTTIPKSLLATLFINTVSNSIKYSKKNFGEGWCNFRVNFVAKDDVVWRTYGEARNFRRSTGLLMTTTDNGIGVPTEMQQIVFDRERRVVDTDVAPGFGLGLFHVKRVVEALGGQAWLRSPNPNDRGTEGYSTRVFMLLPSTIAGSK